MYIIIIKFICFLADNALTHTCTVMYMYMYLLVYIMHNYILIIIIGRDTYMYIHISLNTLKYPTHQYKVESCKPN